MKIPMQIREATGEEMLTLWGRENDTTSTTAKFFCDNIASGNAIFWTIDNDGELIGELYGFLDLNDKDFADGSNTAYLCAFRVKEEYRGQGLGSSLLEHAINKLREMEFRNITIGVGSDEPQNIRLYNRFGFTEKIKDCHYDPCSLDENGQPDYEEKTWWLLRLRA